MDYIVRYGLEFNPFLKNSKEVLINTTEYKETSLLSRRHAQFLLAGVMKEEAAYFRDVGVICM